MRFGHRDVCLDHDTGSRHPETADRIRAIKRTLSDRHGVEYVAADSATGQRIRAVHGTGYVDEVEAFCADGGGNWDADTVACEATWEAALASAGLAEWVAERALAGDDGRDTPFSLGRPPGHHAITDDAMGFCFFNNAAVAAQSVLDAGEADRVAIFDWDVHHGNGTQDIFYDRGDVFYVSIHEKGLYPGTGGVSETGEGAGEGTTLNVPFRPGTTHTGYLAALDEVIEPAVGAFDPDLLLVSAGFDAHEHDPISRMRVSTEGFGLLTERVREFCERTDTGLGFVLEGGYGLDTLSESVRMVHEVFDGYKPAREEGSAGEDARDVIERIRTEAFDSL